MSRIIAIPARYAAEVERVLAGLQLAVDCDEACRDLGIAGDTGYLGNRDDSRIGTLYIVVAHSADDITATPISELARPAAARKTA